MQEANVDPPILPWEFVYGFPIAQLVNTSEILGIQLGNGNILNLSQPWQRYPGGSFTIGVDAYPYGLIFLVEEMAVPKNNFKGKSIKNLIFQMVRRNCSMCGPVYYAVLEDGSFLSPMLFGFQEEFGFVYAQAEEWQKFGKDILFFNAWTHDRIDPSALYRSR